MLLNFPLGKGIRSNGLYVQEHSVMNDRIDKEWYTSCRIVEA